MESIKSIKELGSKPCVIKDILLLSPGIWNGTEYTQQEIIKSFNNTNWNDKKNTHLYLDHQDTKERGVGNWAGFIRNPHLVNNSELWGDLEIWNPLIATFLKEAKAKFGVSATLAGIENSTNTDGASEKMEDFHFESFSIVTEPACKPALINLSEEKKLKTITLSKISSEDIEFNREIDSLELDDKKNPFEEKENIHESDTDSQDINYKEDEMAVKKLEEVKEVEEVKEEVEEIKEEEKPEEVEKEEVKEESVLENISKKLSELSKEVQQIKKKLEEEKPEEESEEEEKEEELKEDVEKIKKELSMMQEEFGRPDRKTLSVSDGVSIQDANEGMLGFLQNRIRE